MLEKGCNLHQPGTNSSLFSFPCHKIPAPTHSPALAPFSRRSSSPFQLKLWRVSRSNLHSRLYFHASCITSFSFSSSFSPVQENKDKQELCHSAFEQHPALTKHYAQLFPLASRKLGNWPEGKHSYMEVHFNSSTCCCWHSYACTTVHRKHPLKTDCQYYALILRHRKSVPGVFRNGTFLKVATFTSLW